MGETWEPSVGSQGPLDINVLPLLGQCLIINWLCQLNVQFRTIQCIYLLVYYPKTQVAQKLGYPLWNWKPLPANVINLCRNSGNVFFYVLKCAIIGIFSMVKNI